jgi:hypothetical protein
MRSRLALIAIGSAPCRSCQICPPAGPLAFASARGSAACEASPVYRWTLPAPSRSAVRASSPPYPETVDRYGQTDIRTVAAKWERLSTESAADSRIKALAQCGRDGPAAILPDAGIMSLAVNEKHGIAAPARRVRPEKSTRQGRPVPTAPSEHKSPQTGFAESAGLASIRDDRDGVAELTGALAALNYWLGQLAIIYG